LALPLWITRVGKRTTITTIARSSAPPQHLFIVENIKKQIALGCHTDTCFCFGTGQNEKFIKKLNEEYNFFKEIIALEHPRFIMQYKAKSKQAYIDKYLEAFSSI
jgi:hypothetical protein